MAAAERCRTTGVAGRVRLWGMFKLPTDWPTRAVVTYALMVHGGTIVNDWTTLWPIRLQQLSELGVFHTDNVVVTSEGVLFLLMIASVFSKHARHLLPGAVAVWLVPSTLDNTYDVYGLWSRAHLDLRSTMLLMAAGAMPNLPSLVMAWVCHRALRWSGGRSTVSGGAPRKDSVLDEDRVGSESSAFVLSHGRTRAMHLLQYEHVSSHRTLEAFLARVTIAYSAAVFFAGVVGAVLSDRAIFGSVRWRVADLLPAIKVLGYVVALMVGVAVLAYIRRAIQPVPLIYVAGSLSAVLVMAGLLSVVVWFSLQSLSSYSSAFVFRWQAEALLQAMAVPAFVYLMSRTR